MKQTLPLPCGHETLLSRTVEEEWNEKERREGEWCGGRKTKVNGGKKQKK
jgi:hypothetical protein